MHKSTNVLIFPCGSEVGLELLKSLSFSTHFTLFGASSVADHGEYVFENYISGVPNVDEDDFLDKLNAVVRKYEIDYIFPAHDSVVLRLAQAAQTNELACGVITSPLRTCEVARSKGATYELLQNVVPVPHRYQPGDVIESFPVFLKPDVGQGSKGTAIARTQDEIDYYLNIDPTLLVLEYLPGKEFTIDCFTDHKKDLLYAEGRERARIANGISVNSTLVHDERFLELAMRINSSLTFRGAWFFQVKENSKGELVLMEVATRIAGTMGLARCRGVNLPLLSLFDALGLPVKITENKYEITIDRALQNSYKHSMAYKHVYIDLDDLIIFKGKVNPRVMAYVYQCINNKIKIHLITRHPGNLDSTLETYRLTGLFDEVIWIRDEAPKSSFIHEKEAIFIDDSFAERNKVFEESNIPVFDAHMVESLMEK